MAQPILVVDDTAEIREMIAETLASEGYVVQCAANGADALAVMERSRPALVLLDLHMPVLDGWGFARALADRSAAVPIVVLTAAGNTAQRAEEVGAVACIGKPFGLTDLLHTVEAVYRVAEPD